jgi:molecular chaperone GrpE (heat shock protein)
MNDQSISESPELAVLKRRIAELEAREARIQADFEQF